MQGLTPRMGYNPIHQEKLGTLVWVATHQKELWDPDGQAEQEAPLHPLSNKLLT